MATSELKPLVPYLQRAAELQAHEPLVAYYCRLYALERGMKIPNRNTEINSFLGSILKQLEKDKKNLQLNDDDAMHVEGFALAVFQKADKVDRAGKADLNTAKIFYAASLFFEILRQFGELTPEIESKQKYAAWKAGDIRKAIERGVTPQPGPPTKGDEEEEQEVDADVEVQVSSISASVEVHPSKTEFPTVERPPTPLPESLTPGQTSSLTPQPLPTTMDGPPPSGGYYSGSQHQLEPSVPPTTFAHSSPLAFSPLEKPRFGMPVPGPAQPPPSQQSSSYGTYPTVTPTAPPTMPPGAGERPSVPLFNPGRTSYTSSQPSSPYVGPPAQTGGFTGGSGVPPQRGGTHGSEGVGHTQQGWAAPVGPGGGARVPGGGAGAGHPVNGAFSATHPSLPPEKVAEAHKAARFAVSALAFDDVPTAVTYLQRSLQLLMNPSTSV